MTDKEKIYLWNIIWKQMTSFLFKVFVHVETKAFFFFGFYLPQQNTTIDVNMSLDIN